MRQKIGQKTKHTFIPKTSLSHHPEPHLKSTSGAFPFPKFPPNAAPAPSELIPVGSQPAPRAVNGKKSLQQEQECFRRASLPLPAPLPAPAPADLWLSHVGANYYRVLPLPYKLLCSHKSLSQLERRDAGAPLSCSSCSQLFPGSQSLPFGWIINQERRTRSFCSSCCAPSTPEWGIPKNPSLHQEFRGE